MTDNHTVSDGLYYGNRRGDGKVPVFSVAYYMNDWRLGAGHNADAMGNGQGRGFTMEAPVLGTTRSVEGHLINIYIGGL